MLLSSLLLEGTGRIGGASVAPGMFGKANDLFISNIIPYIE
jgi:hypothetical protein